MIISHALRYVYIGIPRTGSKSMNRWLLDHFQGEWFGEHHAWNVPAEARDYFIFTIVRNPYDREMSAWHFIPWSAPEDRTPLPVSEFAAGMRGTAKYKDGTTIIEGHETPEVRMNQANYVARAGVKHVLHFERLPHCLTELPFVVPNAVPPFPHRPERGVRPPGGFFDHFKNPEDEAAVWAYADDDFAAFGYRRYSDSLL
ncbi:MAG: sulfotransferase family 2 domain-containing protein [Chloroflexi bacterium]|nr:sulfotransferase family 2 domain-containing protein [Chloroflexota bacterium]